MKSKKDISIIIYLTILSIVTVLFTYYDIKAIAYFLELFISSSDATWLFYLIMLFIHIICFGFLVVENFILFCKKTPLCLSKQKYIIHIILSTIALTLIILIIVFCIINNLKIFNSIKNEVNVEQLKILRHQNTIQSILIALYCTLGIVSYVSFVIPMTRKYKNSISNHSCTATSSNSNVDITK